MGHGKRETMAGRAWKLWTGAIFAAFLAAVAVYVALLQMEKNMLSEYEKAQVWVAIQEIPAGELLTEPNAKDYFEPMMVDAQLVPETAFVSGEEANGLVAIAKIEKGVFLTKGMFQPLEEITQGMQEPVVAGFKAEDLSQVVGGVLRAGDRIHIYASEEEMTSLIWENVYVQKVFDINGHAIGNED